MFIFVVLNCVYETFVLYRDRRVRCATHFPVFEKIYRMDWNRLNKDPKVVAVVVKLNFPYFFVKKVIFVSPALVIPRMLIQENHF